MGCLCSKTLRRLPPSTLEHLQHQEGQRAQPRHKADKKRQRQLAQLQKRHADKKRHRQGGRVGSMRRSRRRSSRGIGDKTALAPHLRLLGGSNGSSATECASALYARTIEQQREDHQRIIEQKTRQQLERELPTFLLNQLVLVTQFFGHFEAELAAIDEELQGKQRESAQQMTDQTLFFASAIDVAVAKRLKFKTNHGPHKHESQPLQAPLTYVIFENVDIARPDDANYDSIATLCKVLMETDYYHTTPCRTQYTQLLEKARWKGYVRLKLREQVKVQRPISSDDGVYTDGSSGYSTAASIYSNAGSNGGGNGGSGKRGTGADDDYDYVYIARLNTHRPIADLKLPGTHVPLESNVLPEACVSRLGSYVESWMEATDDEETQSDDDDDGDDEESDEEEVDGEEESQGPGVYVGQSASPNRDYETVQVLRQCRVEQERRRALLQQNYLNSAQFMNYFGELLRQQLAPQLRIPHSQLAAGTYRACSIYTGAGELVPAIHVPHSWPDCAFEFNLRARPLITNLHTGEQFQWPSPDMRKRIQSFGYHVVPVGYAPKRSRNPFRELEWRIVFPQAEQFLERQLTRTQLKVFMLMKALVKTFVEPHEKGQAMCHAVEFLRMHLFWECERHYNDWPEEFLGEALVRFVSGFATCLAKKELCDYFIVRRNLFEHVPEDALMTLRSIMADIAAHPLMHVLMALRNLDHAADFYPKLNHHRLYENLVVKDYMQLRSWAKFARMPPPAPVDELVSVPSQTAARPLAAGAPTPGLLGISQHQERTRGKLRRKTQMMRAQEQQKLAEQQQRRSSVDSMDIELLVSRTAKVAKASGSGAQLNDGVEILRRTNLLELILDHMLAMIAKANEFRNMAQAQLYLAQAQRLCRLYQQLGCDQNAQQYAGQLCEAALHIERMRDAPHCSAAAAPAPPALPRRLSGSSLRTPGSVSVRRKSLKFVEHVVEVDSGVVSPLQQPYRHTAPPTIMRTQQQPTDEIEVTPEAPTNDPEPRPADDSASSPASSNVLNTLLHKLNVDPQALQALTSKTEQMLQTVAPEAKREELLNLFKRNTQKVKDAFN